ncbi:thiazole synthase, partial [Acinetobacter baumannii]
GVLRKTAVSGANDPVKMAHAMKLAVEAGRLSYEAGRIPAKSYGTASSPGEGLPV